MINTFVSDLVHAARTLSRARAFTAVCVVSLGLGMGVVIAILLLLRMLFGTLFLALAQQPASTVLVIARGTPSDASMRGAFANAIAGGLRMLPGRAQIDAVFRELITGGGQIANSRSDILTMSAMGGIAATVALILATLGVYGVIAFMVATRIREIGIRVALGASSRRVLREVLGSALLLVVPGIGIGLILAVVWVRLIDPSWYPLGGVEPLVYSIAAAAAFLVAVLAGIPSARRAASVQPMVAMRAEYGSQTTTPS